MAKGNPSPVCPPAFLEARKEKIGDRGTGNPIATRYEKEVDEVLRDKTLIPDRQQFIRDAVAAALRAKGLLT